MPEDEASSTDAAKDDGSAKEFYELAKWRVTEQLRSIESIERKIASTIAIWGVFVLLFLGLFAFDDREPANAGGAVGACEIAILSLIGIVFLGSALSAVLGYRVADWKLGPRVSRMQDWTGDHEESELLMRAGKAFARSRRINEDKISSKSKFANVALYLALLALVLIAIWAIAFGVGY